MNPFLALLEPLLLGAALLAVCLRGTPLRYKPLFFLAVSFPAGIGMCSLILFAALLLGPAHAGIISTLLSLGLLLGLIKPLGIIPFLKDLLPVRNPLPLLPKIRPANFVDRQRWLQGLLLVASIALFCVTLFAVIDFFLLSASANVTGGWDARYVWALKAKFMFRSTAEWQGMFSSKLAGAHPNYPLLLPGAFAWGWHFLGRESLFWPPLVSLGLYLSCAFLLTWYLAASVSKIAGFLAGTFFLVLGPYLFWSIHQYADVPLAYFMTSCGLVLVVALRSEQPRLFLISGFLGGLASWTKNEGLIFLLSIGLLLAGILCVKHQRNLGKSWGSFQSFLLGAALPVLAVLILKCYLGTGNDYEWSKRPLLEHLSIALGEGPQKVPQVFKAFYTYTLASPVWKGLGLFFIAALVVAGLKKARIENSFGWLPGAIVVLTNLGYALVLCVSPYDLNFQIETALERLLLHSGILAIAFCFEILTFVPKTPVTSQ